MPIFDFDCDDCGNKFESIEKFNVKTVICPNCGEKAKRVFPRSAPKFELLYDPKKDKVDWNGNTSQYYRLYNEAKERGEKVSLPE
jgi:putative FmdB family regulatory protein